MDFNDDTDDDATVVEAGSVTSMMEELVSLDSLEEDSSSDDDDSVGTTIAPPPAIVKVPVAAAATPSTSPTKPTNAGGDPTTFTTPVSTNKKQQREQRKKQFNSIAHDNILDGNLVLFHVDIETGGKNCGIVQLATIAFDVEEKRALDSGFNKYINPGSCYWDDNCIAVHGIQPSDVRITSADGIDKVWKEWKEYVEGHLTGGKVGCIVAWGGKSCDCEWLFKTTVGNFYGSGYEMPNNCPYFMDPRKVINNYKSCELHPSKSGVLGLCNC